MPLLQCFLALIEEFNEILKAAKSLEYLSTGLAVFAGGALVSEGDLQSLVKERHFAETGFQRFVIENGGFLEDLGVGPERYRGTAGLRGTYLVKLFLGFAMVEGNLVFLAIATHAYNHLSRKRIHN